MSLSVVFFPRRITIHTRMVLLGVVRLPAWAWHVMGIGGNPRGIWLHRMGVEELFIVFAVRIICIGYLKGRQEVPGDI